MIRVRNYRHSIGEEGEGRPGGSCSNECTQCVIQERSRRGLPQGACVLCVCVCGWMFFLLFSSRRSVLIFCVRTMRCPLQQYCTVVQCSTAVLCVVQYCTIMRTYTAVVFEAYHLSSVCSVAVFQFCTAVHSSAVLDGRIHQVLLRVL